MKLPVTSRLAPPVWPSTVAGTPCCWHSAAKLGLGPGTHGHHGPRRRLAEQHGERVRRQFHDGALAAGQAALGQRDGQPAVGQVVRGLQQAAAPS